MNIRNIFQHFFNSYFRKSVITFYLDDKFLFELGTKKIIIIINNLLVLLCG